MAIYKHGTYGEIVPSIGNVSTKGRTVAVYVGSAPVHLTSGFAARVNMPVKINNMDEARNLLGYSDDWDKYDLCEAFTTHFANPAGGVGPIVAINVLDPATDKTGDQTAQVTFADGVGRIHSDVAVLDSVTLAGKTRHTHYEVSYDFTHGDVVITSVGEPLTGTIEATYDIVTPTTVQSTDIIGGKTAEGIYTGLGCVDLVYQELGLIPNLILCPKWSTDKTVYAAMLAAASKINGHWDAMVYADIPIASTETIAKAKAWQTTNGYTNERSKVFWPQAVGTDGKAHHLAVLAAWRTMRVDADHDGVPMESPSNKALPVARQYFGAESTNRGYDQQTANQLNEVGITTICYWGGKWVLWGSHTAAYKSTGVADSRVIFDTTIRMLMHISNSFQEEHGLTVDQPMTRALADTIKNREQEKADALAAVGALIGTPVVSFRETDNTIGDLIQGEFTWGFAGTPTPPFKAATLKVAYTVDGYASYYGDAEESGEADPAAIEELL